MQLGVQPDFAGVYLAVERVLNDHFDEGLDSPTSAALSAGRARVIVRDAANEDALPVAVSA